MDWFIEIDAYCERLGPGYWAEPVNAVTNLAFLIAAAIMAMRLRGTRLPLARVLMVLLALIGIASYLFHTQAQAWTAAADTGFIALFILVYVFAASRDYLGLSLAWSAGAVVLYFPFTATLTPIFGILPILGESAAYLPVAVLIAIYGLILRQSAPDTARGLLIGAGVLFISITFRSLDMPLCNALPIGTHFAWHLLNAVMLVWMIEVYRRHMLAPPSNGR